MKRRSVTTAIITIFGTILSGCTFGREEHRALTIINQDSLEHNIYVEITESTHTSQGNIKFFSEETTIYEQRESTYDQAIAVSDGPPTHIWVEIVISEEVAVEGEYSFPEDSIQIIIDSENEVNVKIDS